MPRTLIRNAQIVTMDDAIGDIARGDILVEDGTIRRIGSTIEAGDADVIDASNMVALPGMIEAHNCVWQTVLRGYVPNLWAGTYFPNLLPLRTKFAAEDNYNATYVGAYETMSYGATTLVDYCHNVRGPGFAEASLAALRETGIRHVFTHSFMNAAPDLFAGDDHRYRYAEDIYRAFHDPDSLTTINFGIESFGAKDCERQIAFARRFNAPSCIHVNDANDIAQLAKRNLLGSDLLAIHGNLITNDELAMMAEADMPLCFTPSADVQGTPADVVRRARDRGVRVVFGSDVPCHVAADTLGQLRAMFYVQGYLDGAMERSFSSVTTRRPTVRPGMPLLTPRDLLRSATIEAAKVFGLDDRIGSLTPGKRADILLVNKGPFGDSIDPDACAHVLLQTSPRDIDTVIVDGQVRMAAGVLKGFDAERAKALMAESRARILGGVIPVE